MLYARNVPLPDSMSQNHRTQMYSEKYRLIIENIEMYLDTKDYSIHDL